MAKLFANSGDPDQMPHYAASDLGLHCLLTRTVFSEVNVCPPTSLNRHIVKMDCIYIKLKVTIYLYVSLVKIHPFLNEIGC